MLVSFSNNNFQQDSGYLKKYITDTLLALPFDFYKLAIVFRVSLLFLKRESLLLWLSKERNCCCINFATFCLPWAHSLCCLSKEFASKKRKKFLIGQWSERTHGKRKVAHSEWQLLLSVDSQSINLINFRWITINVWITLRNVILINFAADRPQNRFLKKL